jgi:hypothetical protein
MKEINPSVRYAAFTKFDMNVIAVNQLLFAVRKYREVRGNIIVTNISSREPNIA